MFDGVLGGWRIATTRFTAVSVACVGMLGALAPALAIAAEEDEPTEYSTGVTIGLIVVFVIGIGVLIWFVDRAEKRKKAALTGAMEEYASERRLTYEGDDDLPTTTPLLDKRGRSRGTVSGELAPGLRGQLTNYSFTEGSGRSKRTFNYAAILASMPELGGARFYCFRRESFGVFEGISDRITAFQTLELESSKFNSVYRLMVRDEASMVALRQLFPPSFIDYMTERVPPGFWFEVEGGSLLGAMRGEHWRTPQHLDALIVATDSVARHIREDLSQRAGLRAATTGPPPPPVVGGEPPPPPPPPPR